MTRTRRELLGAGAVLAVAGCTGNGGQGNADGDDGGASDSGTRVTVESHSEYGDLLADGDGRTVSVRPSPSGASGSRRLRRLLITELFDFRTTPRHSACSACKHSTQISYEKSTTFRKVRLIKQVSQVPGKIYWLSLPDGTAGSER
jgi:hypothetical protein